MNEDKLFEKINANAERRRNQQKALSGADESAEQSMRHFRDLFMVGVGIMAVGVGLGVWAADLQLSLGCLALGVFFFVAGVNL